MELRHPEREKKHFSELDALRGVAAAIVMLNHWSLIYLGSTHSAWLARVLKLPPLSFLFEGPKAVITFFLLSGFVLSLPQFRGRPVEYGSYLVKRICRIYLPYLFALALAVAANYRFHGYTGYGSWFMETWAAVPDKRSILQHVFFLGDYDTQRYNAAFWSLVQEMRISIFFPLLCAFVLRLNALGGVALALAFLAGGPISRHLHMPYTYTRTIEFTGLFVLGILLARYRETITNWLALQSRLVYWSLFVASILIYFMVSAKLACVAVLTFALAEGPVSRLLRRGFPVLLGRVSYSLYLLHGTVLFLFAYLLHDRLSPTLWLAPYLLVSFGLAVLMYDWIEVPAISLGRRLAALAHRAS